MHCSASYQKVPRYESEGQKPKWRFTATFEVPSFHIWRKKIANRQQSQIRNSHNHWLLAYSVFILFAGHQTAKEIDATVVDAVVYIWYSILMFVVDVAWRSISLRAECYFRVFPLSVPSGTLLHTLLSRHLIRRRTRYKQATAVGM